MGLSQVPALRLDGVTVVYREELDSWIIQRGPRRSVRHHFREVYETTESSMTASDPTTKRGGREQGALVGAPLEGGMQRSAAECFA